MPKDEPGQTFRLPTIDPSEGVPIDIRNATRREIVLTPRIRFVIEKPPKGRRRFRLKLVEGGQKGSGLKPDSPSEDRTK